MSFSLSNPGGGGAMSQMSSIPLASLMSMAPNAAQMQRQNPALAWYMVPGMFQAPQQAAAAPAANPMAAQQNAGVAPPPPVDQIANPFAGGT